MVRYRGELKGTTYRSATSSEDKKEVKAWAKERLKEAGKIAAYDPWVDIYKIEEKLVETMVKGGKEK